MLNKNTNQSQTQKNNQAVKIKFISKKQDIKKNIKKILYTKS